MKDHNIKKYKTKILHRISLAVICLCFLCAAVATPLLAAAGTRVTTYIDKTYDYEKGNDNRVLTDAEAKTALTEATDLLIMASGRDAGRTAVTDDEFSTYLGYVNVQLRNGNGSYRSIDFLRGALAVKAAGGDPGHVGNDANGNRVDLLYKGLYSRSLGSLEKEGIGTVAYALLTVDGCFISDPDLRANGSAITRAALISSLTASAESLSNQSVPDVGTCGLVLSALGPYYYAGDSAVVAAANGLLTKLGGLQASNGSIKDSTSATAAVLTALCSMHMDPQDNAYFSVSLLDGLLVSYQSNGGFSAANSGTATSAATSAARCGLVAYLCYQEGGSFYDFSAAKSHSVKNIATTTNNTNTTTKANSTTTKSATTKSGAKTGTSTTKSTGSSTGTAADSTQKSTTVTSQGTMVAKSVFEGIQGQDTSYVYEGTWGDEEPYSISFKGTDITNPMDFNAAISAAPQHQFEIDAAAVNAEYICFQHSGAFPGKAAATVTVSIPDGSYQCYHYSDATGKFELVSDVTVSGGMVSFSLSEGGDYFITTEAVDLSDISMSLGDTVDGIVPTSVFEDIQGKEVDLILTGTTSDTNVGYEIRFHGVDIYNPMDFDMRMSQTSKHEADIKLMGNEPMILHFEHDGDIPGPATVTMNFTLDSTKNYGLFYFNEETNESEYCGDVENNGNSYSFALEHCSDYYISEANGEAMAMGGAYVPPISAGTWILELILVLASLVGVVYRANDEGFLEKLLPGVFGKKQKEAPASAGEKDVPGTADEIPALETDGLIASETGETTEKGISPVETLIEEKKEKKGLSSLFGKINLKKGERKKDAPQAAEEVQPLPKEERVAPVMAGTDSLSFGETADEISPLPKTVVKEDSEASGAEPEILAEAEKPAPVIDHASFMRPKE